MSLYESLLSFLPGKRIAAFANLAAERAHDAVWLRVIRQAITMNEHEARGYIRSRAAAVIQRETDRILFDAPAIAPARANLVRRATDIAVESIWTQVASLRRESQLRRRTA